MTTNPDSLGAQLMRKLGREPVEDTRTEVHQLADQLLDSMRAEGDLALQVEALQNELARIKQDVLLAAMTRNRELEALVTRLAQPSSVFAEQKAALAASEGGVLSAGWAETVLQMVVLSWKKDVLSTLDCLKGWVVETLVQGRQKHTELKARTKDIAKLTPHEAAYWHQAEVYLAEFSLIRNKALDAVTAALAAVGVAQATLVSPASAVLVEGAFLAAQRAVEQLDNLYSVLARDTQYDIERTLVSAEGYMNYHVRESRASADVSWRDEDDISQRATGRYPQIATHQVDEDWRYEDDHHYRYEGPAVNYATGLPMQGGGSMIDVGGNVFGTGNFGDL